MKWTLLLLLAFTATARAGDGDSDTDAAPWPSEIDATIRTHSAEIRACYDAALLSNPAVSGQMVVAFEVNAEGLVIRATVRESTLKNRALERCIVARLKTWLFPEPRGRSTLKVAYPFVFGPPGD